MAIYLYKCPNGHIFDEVFRIGEAPNEIECDKCTSIAKKMPAIGGFSLKGDGWPGKELKSGK
jgi:predicted nucleic acid-binding Zn ribbon protein